MQDGASVRVGPLDFKRAGREDSAPDRDGTPLPSDSAETAAALAAVKATTAAVPAKSPARDTTPNPAKISGSGTPTQPTVRPGMPAKATGAVPQPAAKPATSSRATKPGHTNQAPALQPGTPAANTSEGPSLTSSESVSDEDHDRIAAMLLGMDESGNGSVPEGSTVMDIPTPRANAGDPATAEAKPGEPKKEDKAKVAQTREEMSSAANDLLRKYMRRPK